jgi:hypothetical protein
MSGLASIALLAAMAAGPPAVRVPRRPHPAVSAPKPQAANFTLNVSPATITFTTTNNPSATPVVAASQPATLTWTATSFLDNNNWTLTVQSGAASFANCPGVPVSAVTVTCTAASLGGFGGTASCNGPFTLSTAPQQIAGGGIGIFTYNYSVTVNFTLADSWKYIAEQTPACSLTLNYVANVP